MKILKEPKEFYDGNVKFLFKVKRIQMIGM